MNNKFNHVGWMHASSQKNLMEKYIVLIPKKDIP